MTTHLPQAEIKKIDLHSFSTYLRATRWKEVGDFHNKASIWVNCDRNQNEFEILLPKHSQFFDYVRRLAETLQTLEAFEHRSQSEILQDIVSPGIDVIRIRLDQPEDWRNGIPLHRSLELTQTIEKMLKIAALQAVGPGSMSSFVVPQEVPEYLGKIRIKINEDEDFEMNIISPLSETNFSVTNQFPFERKVVEKLAWLLNYLKTLVTTWQPTGVKMEFDRDLLEAVIRLGEGQDKLEVCFSGSRRFPISQVFDHPIRFSRDNIENIKVRSYLLYDKSPIVFERSMDFSISKGSEIPPKNYYPDILQFVPANKPGALVH